MTLDLSHIQRITKEGLFYLDEAGEEQFISFAVCHLNYVMSFVENGQTYSREGRQEEIQWRRNYKCVAMNYLLLCCMRSGSMAGCGVIAAKRGVV